MKQVNFACQWFKNGDHPEDECYLVYKGTTNEFLSEGKVVRYYRNPDVSGQSICKICGNKMHVHGWIDTHEDGHVVCPSDWIIKGNNGEFYPVKNEIFKLMKGGKK